MPAPVLITTSPFGTVNRAALDLLDRHGIAYDLNPYGRRIRPEELRHHLRGRRVLIAGTETISGEAMDVAPELRLIAKVSIGLDSVDLLAARRRGIVVTYTPDGPSEAVSEFTVGLMISLLRGLPAADRDMHAGRWQRRMGRRLAKVTIGVVGAGRVGARVIGHLLGGFPGVRVLAHDIVAPARAGHAGVEWVGADRIYRESDVVTLHVPLTPHTRGMVGAPQLAAMKRDAFLLNTARGEVVDEAALADVLRGGRIAGAAIDVFGEEPYYGELSTLDNCLLTCHMGSMSEDCRARMEYEAASEAVALFKGRMPVIPVPEEEYAIQAQDVTR